MRLRQLQQHQRETKWLPQRHQQGHRQVLVRELRSDYPSAIWVLECPYDLDYDLKKHV